MGQDDRRKFSRKKKQSVISFHIIKDEEKQDCEKDCQKAEVIDGSEGGVRFKAKKSLSKNTRLYIKLDSEEWGEELTLYCKDGGQDLVEMVGSVMWCLEDDDRPGEFEVGTRFIGQVEQ